MRFLTICVQFIVHVLYELKIKFDCTIHCAVESGTDDAVDRRKLGHFIKTFLQQF